MVIKVFIASITANMELRKNQQRVLYVLQGHEVEHEEIDIARVGNKDERDFMHETVPKMENGHNQLPPQIFNDGEYCGGYDEFEFACENNQLPDFLKLTGDEIPESLTQPNKAIEGLPVVETPPVA